MAMCGDILSVSRSSTLPGAGGNGRGVKLPAGSATNRRVRGKRTGEVPEEDVELANPDNVIEPGTRLMRA
jgi:hypothetical protein